MKRRSGEILIAFGLVSLDSPPKLLGDCLAQQTLVARFLASFLKALGVRLAVLIAHSYGALVCLRYSAQYLDIKTVRQLILLAPYSEHQRNFTHLASRAVYHTIRITPEPISQRMLASNFYNRASAKLLFVSDNAELKARLLQQGRLATRKVPMRVPPK